MVIRGGDDCKVVCAAMMRVGAKKGEWKVRPNRAEMMDVEQDRSEGEHQ